jgi:hypothetical protein
MRTKGFALLGTLLLLAMLTALALYLRVQSTTESQIALVHAAREEAAMAMRAALENAIYHIYVDGMPKPGPFLEGTWNHCRAQVQFSDEGAKIDLNFGDLELIEGGLVIAGFNPTEAKALVNILQQRRSMLGQNVTDIRAVLQNGPIIALEQLKQLPFVDDNRFKRMLDIFTIYSGQEGINLEKASPAVLAAIPGAKADDISAFIEAREKNQRLPLERLPEAQRYAAFSISDTIGLKVDVIHEEGVRLSEHAIIRLEPTPYKPYTFVAWLP